MSLEVLTISAADYCKIYKKRLTDFEAEGVHIQIEIPISKERRFLHDKTQHITECFLKEAKKKYNDVEVIVGYTASLTSAAGIYDSQVFAHASGTALIPRKK